MIDSSLTLKTHVTKVSSKSFSALRLVNRIRKSISPQHFKMIIHALVISNVDYCASILMNTPKTQLCKLQLLLNAALRCLIGLRKYESVKEHYKKHRWLAMEKRIKLRAASLVFTVLGMHEPVYLSQHLNFLESNRHLRSQSQKLLTCPRIQGKFGARAFRFWVPSLWNDNIIGCTGILLSPIIQKQVEVSHVGRSTE